MSDTLILVRSDTGNGGWSLHAPGSTDEQIANGDAPYLVAGSAQMRAGNWSRPDSHDYMLAYRRLDTWAKAARKPDSDSQEARDKRPTVKERLDPASPHHDAELLRLRKEAFPHLYKS